MGKLYPKDSFFSTQEAAARIFPKAACASPAPAHTTSAWSVGHRSEPPTRGRKVRGTAVEAASSFMHRHGGPRPSLWGGNKTEDRTLQHSTSTSRPRSRKCSGKKAKSQVAEREHSFVVLQKCAHTPLGPPNPYRNRHTHCHYLKLKNFKTCFY